MLLLESGWCSQAPEEVSLRVDQREEILRLDRGCAVDIQRPLECRASFEIEVAELESKTERAPRRRNDSTQYSKALASSESGKKLGQKNINPEAKGLGVVQPLMPQRLARV